MLDRVNQIGRFLPVAPNHASSAQSEFPRSMLSPIAIIFIILSAAAQATVAGQSDTYLKTEVNKLPVHAPADAVRQYHVCLAPDIILNHPALLQTVKEAGVNHVWIATFFYGHWPYRPKEIRQAKAAVEQAGLEAHAVLIPLGHPGDSLGSQDGGFPLTPPTTWKLGVRPDGKTFAGTSLHAPATAENVAAIREIAGLGFREAFLDDDFRLARGLELGGCYCDEHRRAFLARYRLPDQQWPDLSANIAQRHSTPLVQRWIDFNCDQLTACFRQLQAASPRVKLGNMVMYLGSEKSGIRLRDYTGALFRVGEGHFQDRDFGPLKGKTDELFSVLFHRRFTPPGLAFSETTTYPAAALSATNMAAKLVISTLADVRNTMFMSGLTPFPETHWTTLAPAMRKNAILHARIAGQPLKGPFKHFWGEAGRLAGTEAKPYSLFLACGVPFEVVNKPPAHGYTFLDTIDARALGPHLSPKVAAHCVVRAPLADVPSGFGIVPEEMVALFKFRDDVIAQFPHVPHVVEEIPAILAWYPSAHALVLWNPTQQSHVYSIAARGNRLACEVAALDLVLLNWPPDTITHLP